MDWEIYFNRYILEADLILLNKSNIKHTHKGSEINSKPNKNKSILSVVDVLIRPPSALLYGSQPWTGSSFKPFHWFICVQTPVRRKRKRIPRENVNAAPFFFVLFCFHYCKKKCKNKFNKNKEKRK